ncbi:MAG: malate synthase G, partial [Rhodobacteraceae bacterium]|nr:malate synthase G [Paracoccaceae bacterium]
MKKRLMRCDLSVEEGLVDFIENTALPDTGVSQNNFWLGLSSLIKEMTPENRKLLRVREELQDKIDKWHVARIGQPH